LTSFRIDGPRVRADLELLENHPQSEFYAELLSKLPAQLGFSISFSGIPRTAEDGTVLADVRDLWSVDLVTRAAANKSIYSAKTVDSKTIAVTENTPAPEAKLEAAAEAAPAAPAAPVAEPAKLAEPTMADISAKLDMILAMLAPAESDEMPEMGDKPKDEAMSAVVEEAPAAETAQDKQPETVSAEAKVEEIVAEAPVANEAAALKAEVAHMKIELEASRGIKPLEVTTEQSFSRADLLSQFNAEKDPRRAAEIFKKLQLAR